MTMDHFLGIQGLTIGGAGIWTLVVFAFAAIIRQWILGIADRKRAENEGMTAQDKAEHDARTLLFEQMQRQMERLEDEVKSLRQRVAGLEAAEREHLKEISDNLREIAQLKGVTHD